jgi:hypothetical protein
MPKDENNQEIRRYGSDSFSNKKIFFILIITLYIFCITFRGISIAREEIIGLHRSMVLVSESPTKSVFPFIIHKVSIIKTPIKPEPKPIFYNLSQFIIGQFNSIMNIRSKLFLRSDYTIMTKGRSFDVSWLVWQGIGNHPSNRNHFKECWTSPIIFKPSNLESRVFRGQVMNSTTIGFIIADEFIGMNQITRDCLNDWKFHSYDSLYALLSGFNSSSKMFSLNGHSYCLSYKDKCLYECHDYKQSSKSGDPLIRRFYICLSWIVCAGLLTFFGRWCLFNNNNIFGGFLILCGALCFVFCFLLWGRCL